MSRAIMQQALAYIKDIRDHCACEGIDCEEETNLVVALEAELAKPEQGPVKCTCGYSIGHPLVSSCSCKPRKPWQGLTDEEIKEVLGLNEAPWSLSGVALQHVMDDARALESKIKEKNNAV
jgi:hypothetical protein